MRVEGLQGTILGLFGNIWIMSYMNLQAGEVIDTHEHDYDHVSIVVSGMARLTVEGRIIDYVAPNLVLIRKEYQHRIESLVDGTSWICAHILPNAKGVPSTMEEIGEHMAHDPMGVMHG